MGINDLPADAKEDLKRFLKDGQTLQTSIELLADALGYEETGHLEKWLFELELLVDDIISTINEDYRIY